MFRKSDVHFYNVMNGFIERTAARLRFAVNRSIYGNTILL